MVKDGADGRRSTLGDLQSGQAAFVTDSLQLRNDRSADAPQSRQRKVQSGIGVYLVVVRGQFFVGSATGAGAMAMVGRARSVTEHVVRPRVEPDAAEEPA